MEDEKVMKIKDAKEIIRGLDNVDLLEFMLYIDELIKNYEDQHKV